MSKVYTLAELAARLDGVFHGQAEYPIQDFASLSRATETDLAYFDNPALLASLNQTKAGAVLLTAAYLRHCPTHSIVVANPLEKMSMVTRLFQQSPKALEGIHATAVVAPSAIIGQGVSVGENSVIGEDVFLGDGVQVAANCVLEQGVSVGSQTTIHNGVAILQGSKIGQYVAIESGAVLGALPFNSVKMQGRWLHGPAVGGVIIADYVQLGANTVIARGALGDTYIGEGVHIDNLVQIAHDVIIGANSAIAGCAAIGAYTQIGEDCIIGGASCVAAHVHLVDDIVITGMSTVNKSLPKPGVYSSGIMVSEHGQWRRNAARFRRLDNYVTRLTKLEKEWLHSSNEFSEIESRR